MKGSSPLYPRTARGGPATTEMELEVVDGLPRLVLMKHWLALPESAAILEEIARALVES